MTPNNRRVVFIAKTYRGDAGDDAISHGNATDGSDYRAPEPAEPLLTDALDPQPVQKPGWKDADGCAGIHHDANRLSGLRIEGLCQSHIHMYDSYGIASGYFSQLTRLLRVPMSLTSISQRSPSTMFSVAPSVPIQRTSPGTSVRYLLISLM